MFSNNMVKKIWNNSRRLIIVSICLLTFTFNAAVANAGAKSSIDNKIEGTAKQVQGKAQKDIGRTQDALDNAGNKIKNKGKKDIKNTQDALDKAAAKLDDAGKKMK